VIAYDGANIRLSVESGDMGGFDGRHGYRVRPEAIQVDQESGLEDKACLKVEESPAKAGDSRFYVYENAIAIAGTQHIAKFSGQALGHRN